MSMSTAYEQTGRTRQKARTRAAMVQAARALLGEGVAPTVEQAAERAAISRTTAYRYFPNQRSLLVATYPELDQASLLGDDAPADPVQRLDLVTETVARMLVEHEPELRVTLRLSLEPGRTDLALRQGRVIAWIEDALAPLRGRLPAPKLRRLVLAIRATLGIEAMVWLTDVARLSSDEATDLMRDSARALLRSALQDAGT